MLVASQVAFQHMLQLLQHPLPPGLDRLEIQNYGLVRVVAHIHIPSASYPLPSTIPERHNMPEYDSVFLSSTLKSFCFMSHFPVSGH
jgi:hypothetical protein